MDEVVNGQRCFAVQHFVLDLLAEGKHWDFSNFIGTEQITRAQPPSFLLCVTWSTKKVCLEKNAFLTSRNCFMLTKIVARNDMFVKAQTCQLLSFRIFYGRNT